MEEEERKEHRNRKIAGRLRDIKVELIKIYCFSY